VARSLPPEVLRAAGHWLDAGWCLRANRLCRRGAVRAGFAAVSRLGDGAFWYLLMAALLLDGRAGLFAAAHLAATGALALLLYTCLKRWTRRPRPFAADLRIRAWVAPLDEFSFPSGHTLHAVAFSIVAIAHYPPLAWLLAPFTAAVATSRVVLGLHYPSDVLAATAIGTVLAAASLWLAGMPPFG
jgi:undecaprenyl-diphosphatase